MASLLEKTTNWSLGAVALITIFMYAFLPLGIFGNNLDFEHFMGLKIGIAAVVAIVSSLYYYKFVKARGLEVSVRYFGLITVIGICGLTAYCLADLALKLFGLE